MKRDHINRLIGELGNRDLQLDAENLCSLIVDDRRECNIELDEQEEWLYLHSPVAKCVSGASSEFLRLALRANLFGFGTRGGHLGLCDKSNMLVLSRRLNVQELDVISLHSAFQDFSAAADELEDELDEAATMKSEQERFLADSPSETSNDHLKSYFLAKRIN
ncbi:MAG: type III secretion system chaperone [Pirellulales bacterium]|nr:type III secretion system chaperone [Pirellulales bacterium]